MAQNDKGGSDLDIFDGLGKKASSAGSPAAPRSVPPPPPPVSRTMLGMAIPSATATLPPPQMIGGAAPSTPSRLPPPPPGRASLPPLVSSLAKPATVPSAPPPPPTTRPRSSSADVKVAWEDEDEATHIFDEEEDKTRAVPTDDDDDHDEDKTRALLDAPPPALRPIPANKGQPTLLGLTAPSGMQPAASRPATRPPPPPPSSLGGRGSAFPPPRIPSAFPPPPTINPLLPPPAPTQPGIGMSMGGMGLPMRPPSVPPAAIAPGSLGMTPMPEPAAPRIMEATAMVRPPLTRIRPSVALAIGLATVIGVVVAFVLISGNGPGQLVINVTDSKGGRVDRVDIFVDGRKQCETSPCRVDQVAAGPHEVKVLADGYDAPPVQTVDVEARKEAPATVALGQQKAAGIRVNGTQPGVKLFVDDRETGILPQEVRDLAPGDHVIRVAGSERYQPMEKHITVDRDRVEDLGTVTLKVLKGKVTISLGTQGARVYLVSGTDRRELPMLPISVDIDTTKAWSLEASKAGFADFKQPIGFDDGQAEKSYVVTLDAKATPAVTWNPPPGPAPAPAPAPVRHEAPATDQGAAEGGEAYLNINSIPPSTCFVDGRSLGSTPRMHVSVKPGTHTVKFVNSDEGLTKSITVSVGAGETKLAVAKLN